MNLVLKVIRTILQLRICNVCINLGFSRVSYGVQDNDPEVQRIINRIQPLENVENATQTQGAIGLPIS